VLDLYGIKKHTPGLDHGDFRAFDARGAHARILDAGT
jgi:hypothetical protein